MSDKKSALDEMNEYERKVQLEGRENPDKFKMKDGSTLADTRKKLEKQAAKEGEEQSKVQSERMREQSIAGDPLYSDKAEVKAHDSGVVTVVPPANPTQPTTGGSQAGSQGQTPPSKPAETPAGGGSAEPAK